MTRDTIKIIEQQQIHVGSEHRSSGTRVKIYEPGNATRVEAVEQKEVVVVRNGNVVSSTQNATGQVADAATSTRVAQLGPADPALLAEFRTPDQLAQMKLLEAQSADEDVKPNAFGTKVRVHTPELPETTEVPVEAETAKTDLPPAPLESVEPEVLPSAPLEPVEPEVLP